MPPARKRLRIRRWLLSVLGVVLFACGAVFYWTQSNVLDPSVRAAVANLGLEVEHLGHVSLDAGLGVRVRDLRVRTARAGRRAAEPLLVVPEARFQLDTAALLAGEPPRRIELWRPVLRLTQGCLRDLLDHGVRWRGRGHAPALSPHKWPQIRISQADVQLHTGPGDAQRLIRRWILDGESVTESGAGGSSLYALNLRQVGGSAAATAQAAAVGPSQARSLLLKLLWDGASLRGEIGPIELAAAAALLPASWQRNVDDWQADGLVRGGAELAGDGSLRRLDVTLSAVRAAAPIEPGLAPQDRFLRIDEGQATISLTPSAIDAADPDTFAFTLDAHGRLCGADARLHLSSPDVSLAAAAPESSDGGATIQGGSVRLGSYRASVEIAALPMPTAVEHPEFVDAEALPRALRAFIDDYTPSGRFDVVCRFSRDSDQADVAFEGEARPLGGVCTYYRFPYRFEDVRGLVRFSNRGIVLDGLTGRHGVATVRADGTINHFGPWTGFDLRFDAANLALDRELYAALPPSKRRAWDEADPVGLCDAVVTLRRPDAIDDRGPSPADARIDARLLSASLTAFGQRVLHNATGMVHIDDQGIRLDGVTGFVDGSLVCLRGPIQLGSVEPDDDDPLRLVCDRFPLDYVAQIGDGAGESLGQVRFVGVGDVWGVQYSGPRRERDRFTIRIREGRLSGFEHAAGWPGASGWLIVDDDSREILSFNAGSPDRGMSGAGIVLDDGPGGNGLRMEFRDARLEELLQSIIPTRWASIRESLGLGGAGSVRLRLEPGQLPDAMPNVDVELHAEHMRPSFLPAIFRRIVSRLTLHDDGFVLHDLDAAVGESGALSLRGAGGWSDQHDWWRFEGQARDVQLTPELRSALPAALRDLLADVSLGGRLNLTLDRARVVRRPHPEWDVQGAVEFSDADLQFGVAMKGIAGRLQGLCELDPAGRLAADLQIQLGRGALSGRPIESADARLVRAPGSPTVELRDLRVRMCDGQIVGSAQIDAGTGDYELSLNLMNLRLADLVAAPRSNSTANKPGRIDGYIFLRGGDSTERRGGGDLRIRDASLLSTPVTASIHDAAAQGRPGLAEGVDQARLTFTWQGHRLEFSRVDLQTRELRLVGTGTWNLADDSLYLTLVSANPKDAPRLSILSDMFEQAGQELMQYRVTGTASQPQVQLEPLHNLTEPIRKLLAGEG